jgi:hypothetical protein
MPKDAGYYHIHICLSVRGALWNRSFDGFRHNDGLPMTRREAFDGLCDELSKGHEKLPMGDCDNFDWKTGCRGHNVIRAAEAAGGA